MAQAIRQSTADFQRDVGARSVQGSPGVPAVIFAAVPFVNSALIADGTLNITRNGIVIARVFWPGSQAAALTDAGGPNQDTLNIYDLATGYVSTVSAQSFITNLK